MGAQCSPTKLHPRTGVSKPELPSIATSQTFLFLFMAYSAGWSMLVTSLCLLDTGGASFVSALGEWYGCLALFMESGTTFQCLFPLPRWESAPVITWLRWIHFPMGLMASIFLFEIVNFDFFPLSFLLFFGLFYWYWGWKA